MACSPKLKSYCRSVVQFFDKYTQKSLAALSSLTKKNNYLERKYQPGADPLAIYEVKPRS